MIVLSPEEQALLEKIRFDPANFHEVAQQNGNLAAALTERLIQRDAIPKVRLRYFTDETLNVGAHKSRKQVFVDNGTAGRAILEHPSFLKYLRYFLNGPRLPQHVVSEFQRRAAEASRELEDLRVFVRASARELPGDDLGEEFFKLALESGLDLFEAKTLRTDAMNTASANRRRSRR